MAIRISAIAETFPIAGKFTISRGAKTEARVVTVTVSDGAHQGRGECVPYARYGESVDSVMAEIRAVSHAMTTGADRSALQSLMRPGAARNAVDCALWDFEAKCSGISVGSMIGGAKAGPLTTAYTLSLGTPDEMAAAARAAAHRPLLKIKLGGAGDIERLRAVAQAAPDSRIIVDANEGWTEDNLEANTNECAALGVALIEQPLPQNCDTILRHIVHKVPICADESAHSSASLPELVGLYDAVNIKLDKTGGLTEALKMRGEARTLGFEVMTGCMVGTSLAMAPAFFLGQGAEFVDLDGPLLLARDREHALRYEGSRLYPPEPKLWG
jgi:L-Ala-D/L-Glu epimerase